MTSFIGFFDAMTTIDRVTNWSSLTLVPAATRVKVGRRTVSEEVIWISDGTASDRILSRIEPNPIRLDLALFVASSLLSGGTPRLFLADGGPQRELVFKDQVFCELSDWLLVGGVPKGEHGLANATLTSLLLSVGTSSIVSIAGAGPHPRLPTRQPSTGAGKRRKGRGVRE